MPPAYSHGHHHGPNMVFSFSSNGSHHLTILTQGEYPRTRRRPNQRDIAIISPSQASRHPPAKYHPGLQVQHQHAVPRSSAEFSTSPELAIPQGYRSRKSVVISGAQMPTNHERLFRLDETMDAIELRCLQRPPTTGTSPSRRHIVLAWDDARQSPSPTALNPKVDMAGIQTKLTNTDGRERSGGVIAPESGEYVRFQTCQSRPVHAEENGLVRPADHAGPSTPLGHGCRAIAEPPLPHRQYIET